MFMLLLDKHPSYSTCSGYVKGYSRTQIKVHKKWWRPIIIDAAAVDAADIATTSATTVAVAVAVNTSSITTILSNILQHRGGESTGNRKSTAGHGLKQCDAAGLGEVGGIQ